MQAQDLCKQILAESATAPITTLLNNLRILAINQNDAELDRWVQLELHGYFVENAAYKEGDVVPNWRIVGGQWRDHIGRPFITEAHLDFINHIPLKHGAAELEHLADGKGILELPDADSAKFISDKLGVRVHKFAINRSAVAQVLQHLRGEIISRTARLAQEYEAIAENGCLVQGIFI